METQKTAKAFLIVVVCIAVVVGLLFFGKAFNPKQSPITDSGFIPGLQITSAPWNTAIDTLKDRLVAIGLPALSEEGTALHIHQHIDIFVHGKSIAIPPGIGINEHAQFISSIHVHDDTGVIHVESPTVQDFTLGQFFDVWGVRFSREAIGGYVSDATNTLKVFINGKEFIGDPRTIVLAPHQEIAVVFGTATELPNPMPAEYMFTVGL
jgi:hypothetical protein